MLHGAFVYLDISCGNLTRWRRRHPWLPVIVSTGWDGRLLQASDFFALNFVA
jgi:hypothetical protein